MTSHIVLVTGGSGFLGQHVVKHLDMYCDDITEIRVLDIRPYEKNLDFEDRKPVTSITGSLTDPDVVRKACKNVKCVFHIAALVEYKLFPDITALNEINIQGTQNVINACKEEGVENLIYCGSISSFFDGHEVFEGTEETVPIAKNPLGEYAVSKKVALEMVIKENRSVLENGKIFQTAAVLPTSMYGEEDRRRLEIASFYKEGTVSRIVGKTTSLLPLVYVGNVAMMFVKVYERMGRDNGIGGHYFFTVDDTPPQSAFECGHMYIPKENVKITLSWWYIPMFVTIAMVTLFYYLLLPIRPFYKVNLPISNWVILSMNKTCIYKNDKAKKMLGYKPLYDYETALKKTKAFFGSVGQT
ncbi:3 beta-hydroxysteroid dehydrogenase/Delta 5--_4-isomerase type 1-like [Mytilus californianus]|uniref:3 beta-hydroxysteroid dehydrogenase/Delta 5-->4-isomerase type 1-like n=1 Tax=Mytilus californianus TaxID=6549 RepID=UPI00224628FE|nr:3 beta-hydroxysteroid dehydrogenase/Delta 5-->4-isomerase type 1-like [Mytilus californianus]